MDILKNLSSFTPLQTYRFGHTPTQVEYFKTVQQSGCPAFTYWHHVLQLKSLYDSLREMRMEMDELDGEISDLTSFWPPWGRKKRNRKLPRLKFKRQRLDESYEQKSREAKMTLDVINTQFSEYTSFTEDDIFSHEKEYWTIRLGKQLVCSQLSHQLGVSEGSLEAVLALPNSQQKEILGVLSQSKLLQLKEG